MTSIDMLVFGFSLLMIGWNIKDAKKRPIPSLIFGLLWVALATSIALGIGR